MYTYKIHLHKEEEGGYTTIVPALPGCITYGENVDEAISMAKKRLNCIWKNWRNGVSRYLMIEILWSIL